MRVSCYALALALVFGIATSQASATDCFAPAPVRYYAAPAVSYYAPPVVSYYAAPVVSYYAPQPAPVVSYYAPAPAVSYYAPAPQVSYYYAPAPVVAAPSAVTTTYRYGLLHRKQVSVTRYYSPVVYP